jgi:hypothetical protein
VTIWDDRDLPVLRALAATDHHEIRDGYLILGDDAAREKLGLDLPPDELERAVFTLRDAGYVAAKPEAKFGFTHLHVTGRGMQAIGQWPSFSESSPATIAALLDRLAEEAPTDAEAVSARRAASYIRSLAASVVTSAFRTVMVEGAKAAIRLGAGA